GRLRTRRRAVAARRPRPVADDRRGARARRAHGRARRGRRHDGRIGRQGRRLRSARDGRDPHGPPDARRMSFEQLRPRHPRFTYEDYAVERGDDALTFTFSFTMDPHIAFAPTTTLRAPDAARL